MRVGLFVKRSQGTFYSLKLHLNTLNSICKYNFEEFLGSKDLLFIILAVPVPLDFISQIIDNEFVRLFISSSTRQGMGMLSTN